MTRPSSLGLAILLILLLPRLASASAWTLPRETLTVSLGGDMQWASDEWLINGDYQTFPLQGRYFAANLRASFRYGISNRVEIGAAFAISHVDYNSDEIYFGAPLVPDVGELEDREQIASNITSLDRRTTGLGDVQLYAKVRLTPDELWRFVFTPELHLKIPTGYQSPVGTFADDDFTEGVADDVTLGDGQLDVTLLGHFGIVPHPRWFNRLSVGIRLRLFGPGPQVVAGYKTGVRIGRFLIPYAELALAHTFIEGRVVGATFATAVPETPAAEFTPDDLLVLDWRPDRSHLTPRVGLILAQPKWELDVSYGIPVWGINVAQTHVVSIGVTLKP